jgi:hypothetical protein
MDRPQNFTISAKLRTSQNKVVRRLVGERPAEDLGTSFGGGIQRVGLQAIFLEVEQRQPRLFQLGSVQGAFNNGVLRSLAALFQALGQLLSALIVHHVVANQP